MTWKLDKQHSHVAFSIRHMMISRVRGTFETFDGVFTASDPADPSTLTIEGSVAVDSIHTGEADRDAHLKSAEFFDAETHPQMTFRSTAVERSGSTVTVTGDMTIRGTTRPITLTGTIDGPAKDPWGNMRIGASLAGSLSREDFGLSWNQVLETGGIMVGKEVSISVDLQAVAQG